MKNALNKTKGIMR